MRISPLAHRWPHSVVYEKEGPNDGLVSLKSAKWVRSLSTSFFPYCSRRPAFRTLVAGCLTYLTSHMSR